MTPPLVPENEEKKEIPPDPSLQPKEVILPKKENEDQSINEELAALNLDVQRDLARQLKEERAAKEQAQRELAQRNETPKSGADFLSDPAKMIRDEVNASIKPLASFVDKMVAREEYGALLDNVKQKLPSLFNAYQEYSAEVDAQMANQPKTFENFQAVVLMTRGAADVGLIKKRENTVTTPKPVDGTSPPYIPPSPPPAPRIESSTKTEELTESQKRFARRAGMTDAEYHAALHSDNTLEGIDEALKGAKK